jgi:hypothetical protein
MFLLYFVSPIVVVVFSILWGRFCNDYITLLIPNSNGASFHFWVKGFVVIVLYTCL